jgi:hypothetical protein
MWKTNNDVLKFYFLHIKYSIFWIDALDMQRAVILYNKKLDWTCLINFLRFKKLYKLACCNELKIDLML